MVTYREMLDSIPDIRLREGETVRIDCPFCGGRKTFTLSRTDDGRVWNCYKASCGVRGGQRDARSEGAIRRKLAGQDAPRALRTDPLPRHLIDPRSEPRAMDYLARNGCIPAFEDGLIGVRYAPADDRVIFLSGEGGVGRGLNRQRPKWKVYGNLNGLVKVGSGDIAVLVEDVASACSVSRDQRFCGCALLGTNVRDSDRSELVRFDRVLIALDKDASRKALQIQDRLQGRVRASVRFLDKDLKSWTVAELQEIEA